MTLRIGINGFGRIGRLVLRAAWDWPDVRFVHINDPGADCATFAHLLAFDSTHGRWNHAVRCHDQALLIDELPVRLTQARTVAEGDWRDCDVVIEASGKMKTRALLQPYLEEGVQRVVVSAPVKEDGIPNIVLGVNDMAFDPARHRIVTAASCTTNCLAPIVKVLHEGLGIRHGSMTTIHALTTSQALLDTPQKDVRRARAAVSSLVPTTTGSARMIGEIFPELKGKLNGHAVRAPLADVSLTDAVFEVERATTADAVNALLRAAADGPLQGILGVEDRPLVSVDFRGDARSSIVDAPSTLVIDGTQVKVFAWYDNEWAYAHRAAELARRVGAAGRVP